MASSVTTVEIPQFPKFTPLALEQADAIQAYSAKFPPYSDFLFSNLWAWDLDQSSEVSILKGNLVYKLRDYEENVQFFTFLGTIQTEQTAKILLDHAQKLGIHNELLYMPEISVSQITNKLLMMVEDRDNFDYILDSERVANLNSNIFRGKRNLFNRFIREFGNKFTVSFDTLNAYRKDLDAFSKRWRIMRNKDVAEVEDELHAMHRVLDAADQLNLQILLVKINGELAGFTIFEVVGDTGIIHFDKALTSFVGIYEFMKQQLAERLVTLHVTKINYEQDLGIEGLRRAKESYHPIDMLKKYKVKKIP